MAQALSEATWCASSLSHVVRLFVNKYPDYHIINLDKLTYAGNLANLKDIENKPNYEFVKMDICDFDAFYKLMQEKKVDGIIHLAAESHVDRTFTASGCQTLLGESA